MNTTYDIAILGGGFVGHTLLHVCTQLGLSVCLVDAKPPVHTSNSDGRAIALSYSSIELLKQLHLWETLANVATPIERVHVSSKGRLGTMVCDAHDLDIPFLGQVIPAPLLGTTLASGGSLSPLKSLPQAGPGMAAAYSEPGIVVGTVTGLHFKNNIATITLNEQDITASLVLACDGTHSFCRDYLNINTEQKQSHKKALVFNIVTDKPHNNTAFQRLIPEGVCALLPLQHHKMTAVLSLDNTKADEMNALSDNALSESIKTIWGGRFGTMRVEGSRFSYPLNQVYARDPVKDRVILMGNAAHTLNPIAAQGLNLAFRDIAVLQTILKDAKALNKNYGEYVPPIYLNRIQPSHERMSRITDFLVNIAYTEKLSPLQGIGLMFLQHLPFIKHKWAKAFAGVDQ